MATDVAPALLEKIQSDFRLRIERNQYIKRVQNRIRDGTATQQDAHRYAEELGHALSASLQSVLTESALPDGRLYYNIGMRTITPMLENNYYLANATAIEVQSILDAAEGIGVQAVSGQMPTGRINGLVGKAAEEETYDGVLRWLKEPIVNCSEAFFDDFVVANASARYRLGMAPKIVRIAESGCCDWCANLAGTYDYEDINSDDVYKRHEFCRCDITFRSGKLMQNVHTKRWYDDSGTSLSNRRRINLDVLRRTPEEARLLDQALAEEEKRLAKARREAAIQAYQQENNVSHRRAANRITRIQNPSR